MSTGSDNEGYGLGKRGEPLLQAVKVSNVTELGFPRAPSRNWSQAGDLTVTGSNRGGSTILDANCRRFANYGTAFELVSDLVHEDSVRTCISSFCRSCGVA